jgi:hypothetical protein
MILVDRACRLPYNKFLYVKPGVRDNRRDSYEMTLFPDMIKEIESGLACGYIISLSSQPGFCYEFLSLSLSLISFKTIRWNQQWESVALSDW